MTSPILCSGIESAHGTRRLPLYCLWSAAPHSWSLLALCSSLNPVGQLSLQPLLKGGHRHPPSTLFGPASLPDISTNVQTVPKWGGGYYLHLTNWEIRNDLLKATQLGGWTRYQIPIRSENSEPCWCPCLFILMCLLQFHYILYFFEVKAVF